MAGEIDPCAIPHTNQEVFEAAKKIGVDSQNRWADMIRYTQDLRKQAAELKVPSIEQKATLNAWSQDASAGLACGMKTHPAFETELLAVIDWLNRTPPDQLEANLKWMKAEIHNQTRAIIPTDRGPFATAFNMQYQPPKGADMTLQAVLDPNGDVVIEAKKKSREKTSLP